MNSLRKVVGILLAMTFAVFALPAIGGPTKQYSLNMEVGPVVAGKGTQVIAHLTNRSPPGVGASNISSWTISITSAAGVKIVGFDQPASGNVTPNPIPSGGVTSLSVTNMSPLKAAKTFDLVMYVAGCGDGGQTWGAHVFPGSSLSGDEFALLAPYQLGTDVPCAVLGCGDSFTVVRADLSGPPATVPVTRGPYNSDGTCNTSTRLFVANLLTTSTGKVVVKWPVADEADAEPDAAFGFTVSNSSTAPLLAWKNYQDVNGDTGIPAFVSTTNPALTCNAPNSANDWFPRPYGRLLATVSSHDNKIKVGTIGVASPVSWPTVFPSDLIVGDEVMTVTKIIGDTWFVDRANPESHSLPLLVMYTPLKQLTTVVCLNAGSYTCPYIVGSQAKACVTTVTPTSYSIMGVGDPVFSGGDF